MEREFEHRITEVESRSKSNVHRLDQLEKRQDDLEKLVSTVAVLAERMKSVENNVEEINKEVKTLNGKSGKKWDNLVNQIIGIVVAAVAGFILAKFGF
jgi:predicted  nucleic acid-binding Zn-ribbon protein